MVTSFFKEHTRVQGAWKGAPKKEAAALLIL